MSYVSSESKARILVVQNDPVMLGLVSGSLRPDGHDIIESNSMLDALQIADREHLSIDLVVTEASSRPISGFEFAKRLIRRGIDMPMLFISGSRSLSDVIASSLGQASVIEEPFTGGELRASVRRCLAIQRRKPHRD